MFARPMAVLSLLVTVAPALAQTPPSTGQALQVHPEAREAIDQLKSPYCPGMMLEVCPSPGGAMLRDSIQGMAESGLTSDSIVSVILGQYGEEWRAEPLRSGTGLWAWVLPPLVLLLGLGTVLGVLSGRRTGPPSAPSERPVAPEDERRLRRALEALEEEEEPVF